VGDPAVARLNQVDVVVQQFLGVPGPGAVEAGAQPPKLVELDEVPVGALVGDEAARLRLEVGLEIRAVQDLELLEDESLVDALAGIVSV